MGRKPTVNLNLPPRMRRKVMVSGKCHYYYDQGGKPRKWLALGNDYHTALKQYADLEINAITEKPLFSDAVKRYVLEIVPTKAPATQQNNRTSIKFLLEFFGTAPLDEINPVHIAQYLDWRKESPASANKNIGLFSSIFNAARRWGFTNAANPCEGIEKHKESGRGDVYIDNETLQSVYQHAAQPLRDFLDLLYLTGQRPADVLKMSEDDIKDGVIHVAQNKTKMRLRIAIVGELVELLERIRARKIDAKSTSKHFIVNTRGHALTYKAVQLQFAKARKLAGVNIPDFQMRDLRAKAGTDKEQSDGIKAAQEQLGHTSEKMTNHYVRNRQGKLVNPTR